MRMPILFAIVVVSSFGCDSPATPEESTDGGVCYPVVHACVTAELGGPSVGATLRAERDGDVPTEATTGSDGCAELDLPPGTWTVRATTTTVCASLPTDVDVPDCGTVELPLMALPMLCVDGAAGP